MYPYPQAPVQAGDIVFRQPRIFLAVGLGVCLVMAVVMILLLRDKTVPPLEGLYLTGFFVLATMPEESEAATSAGAVFVAELERTEVEWVRSYRRVTIMNGSEGKETRASACLEIKLRTAELAELRACIATAGAPRLWHGWSMSADNPVSVTTEGMVRLVWRGGRHWMAPSLKKVVWTLARNFPVQPELAEREDFTVAAADQEKMEQRRSCAGAAIPWKGAKAAASDEMRL